MRKVPDESHVEDVFQHYRDYCEEGRLHRDKKNEIEFVNTWKYLEEISLHLPAYEASVLEIGCGTGAYTPLLAEKYGSVVSCDLIPSHINLLQQKIEKRGLNNVTAIVADARDLFMLKSGQFDLILCMGPMYHLRFKSDRKQCINECRRLGSAQSIAAFSYLSTKALWPSVLGNAVTIDEFLALESRPSFYRAPFLFLSPREVLREIESCNLTVVDHFAIDPLTHFTSFDAINDDNFEKWIKFIGAHKRDPAWIELSFHNMIEVKL